MNRPWFWVRALSLGLLQLTASTALAQTSSSAVSAATGGTGRASVEASDIHSLNPAMLVHLRDRDLHSTIRGNAVSVGITDNARDSVIPAGLAWRQDRTENRGLETKTQDLRLSLADVVKGNFSMGVTGKQYIVSRGEPSWRQVNADVGFAWIPTRRIGLGLVFSDVSGVRDDVPSDIVLRPRSALGFSYLWSEFGRFRADLVSGAGNNFGKSAFLVGYEASTTQFFVVRLGAGTDAESSRDIASAGFGFDLPRFRLNYGAQTVVRGERETWHSVDLGIPF